MGFGYNDYGAIYHPPALTMPPPPPPPAPTLSDLFRQPTNLGAIILNAVAPGYALATNVQKIYAPVAQQAGGPVATLSDIGQKYNSFAENLATQITPVGNLLPVSQEPAPAPPPVTANVET